MSTWAFVCFRAKEAFEHLTAALLFCNFYHFVTFAGLLATVPVNLSSSVMSVSKVGEVNTGPGQGGSSEDFSMKEGTSLTGTCRHQQS